MEEKEFLCRHDTGRPISDFNKSQFRKDGLAPLCNTCGARTRTRDENRLHWLCTICNHPVNDHGDCVAQRRCVACKGKPRCSSCERVSEVNNSGGFSCFSCGHSLTDDGQCSLHVDFTPSPTKIHCKVHPFAMNREEQFLAVQTHNFPIFEVTHGHSV